MRLPKYFLRKHVEKKNLFLNRLHFWQFFSNGGLRVGAIALISISMDGNDFLVLERKQNPKLESPCTGKGFSVVDFAFFLLLWFSSTAITLDHFYDWAMIISTPWIWYQAVFCGNYLHYFHSFTLITCFIHRFYMSPSFTILTWPHGWQQGWQRWCQNLIMSMAVKLRRDNCPPAVKPVRGNKLMADAGQRILQKGDYWGGNHKQAG